MEKQRKQGNLNIKNSRGITLVALVVTIIIMLILAGVALRLALGENGLFKMSEKAVEKYKEEAGKEENALQKGSEEIGNIIESLTTPEPPVDVGEIASNLKEYQGKYVDIGLNTNGNDVTTDDWELFYAGNGRIYLIAADYVPADVLEKTWNIIGDSGKLKDAGFKRYNSTDTYRVTWSSPTFLTLPTEPNNYLDLVMHKGYTLDDSKSNSKAVSQLLNTTSWNGIKEAAGKSDCIDFVIGGPTLEMWCAAWNKAIEGDTYFREIKPEPSTSEPGYKVKVGNASGYSLYVSSSNSQPSAAKLETYKTFFPHTSSYGGCDGYCLASPSARAELCLMFVCYNGRVDYFYYDINRYGVRPVVCLRSEVQLTETSKGSNIYNVSK